MEAGADIKVLVCEGACNRGAVQQFDDAVEKSKRTLVSQDPEQREGKSVALLSPDWIARARRFLHTEHAFKRRDVVKAEASSSSHYEQVYGCLNCGQERVYGRETMF